MKIKKKLLLFFILLSIVINGVFITMASAENKTQSPEEIAQLQAEMEEYDRTHPKPKSSPPPLTSSWLETSTDDKSLNFGTVHADSERVVYREKISNTYHMGHCKYYEEKSGGDYSNPQWLADIVMDGTRCTLCIPDEIYHTYREAVYRQEIQQQEDWISSTKRIITILIVICGFSIILCLIVMKKTMVKIRGKF